MADETSFLAPGLYVVATPLGNAEDLSPRARRVLSLAELLLAEDTRRTGQLLARLGIERAGTMVSLHEHNEAARLPQVLAALAEGKRAALVSDAGTPLLSDPGFELVRACRESGVPVVPVPGPSAPVAALSACGLPPLPYTFLGFAPRKAGQARALLQAHGATGATLVLFERKSRLGATLALAAEELGPARECCICRELTKTYEEFIHGTLGELAGRELDLKGELTVVIGPALRGETATEDEVLAAIEAERAAGGKPKEIARRAAVRCPGWTAKAVYATMRRP